MPQVKQCHSCSSTRVRWFEESVDLSRVTSDCKVWPKGGMVGQCDNCGIVVADTNDNWHAEARKIYEQYSIYAQSGGAEQRLFVDGTAISRSQRLLDGILPQMGLPRSGRLLDVGCGNGAFLKAFSDCRLPEWKLVGAEWDAKYRNAVLSIPGVVAHHEGKIEELDDKFDVVSMIHVLEHIPGPAAYLSSLKSKLNSNATLLVQVPDASANPFDLVIADHCSHFELATLSRLIERCGYRVVFASSSVVAKELTILAIPSAVSNDCKSERNATDCGQSFQWLAAVTKQASQCAATSTMGIFGTSIAATWLMGAIDFCARYFVDEDQLRIGRQHLSCDILSLDAIDDECAVFLAFPRPLAEKLYSRLRARRPRLRWILPLALRDARKAA